MTLYKWPFFFFFKLGHSQNASCRLGGLAEHEEFDQDGRCWAGNRLAVKEITTWAFEILTGFLEVSQR